MQENLLTVTLAQEMGSRTHIVCVVMHRTMPNSLNCLTVCNHVIQIFGLAFDI